MSVTRWGNLKSGKLTILKLNNSSDIQKEKDTDFILNSTPTKNTNINLEEDKHLTVCSLKNTEAELKEQFSSPRKGSFSGSVSSSGKNDSKHFFVPSEIKDIYKGFGNSKFKTLDIADYFFDSCSSGEENYISPEIKSSDSQSDSHLYSVLLRLKKRTLSPWHNNIKRKTLKRRISSRLQNKTFEVISDEDNKSIFEQSFISDSFSENSHNLSVNHSIVEIPQIKDKHIENKTDNNLNKTFVCNIAQDTFNNDDNIKILQGGILAVNAKQKHQPDKGESINTQNCSESEINDNNDSLSQHQFYENFVLEDDNSQENISVRVISDTEQVTSDCNNKNMRKSEERNSDNFIEVIRLNSGSSIENKQFSEKSNRNLNIGSLTEMNNKYKNQARMNKDKISDSDSINSSETDKEVSIKENKREKNAHDVSSSSDSDSDTDRRLTNSWDDQGDSYRTNSSCVIKLSSDSENDLDISNKNTSGPLTFNRTKDRHVSVSSDDNNLDSDISGNNSKPFSEMDFSEDFFLRNEVWLVQCPKSMNVSKIKGQSLIVPSNHNHCTVRDNGSKYECYSHQNISHQTVNVALPDKNNKFHLNVVPLAGSVVFEEKVDVPEVRSVILSNAPSSYRNLPLPEDLKVRHPLLGLDFHDQPKTTVNESPYSYSKTKKHKNRGSLPIGIENDVCFKSPKKKKRKRSNSSSWDVASIDETNITTNDFTQKVPKKKKKKTSIEMPVDVGCKEYSELIENEIPKKKNKKSRNRDASFEDDDENDILTNDFTQKTPKKKKKKISIEMPVNVDVDENDITTTDFTQKSPKNKKKKTSIEMAVDVEETNDTELDVESYTSEKKKKKKRKKHSF